MRTFYHISKKKLTKPLKPRIPKSDYEEQETPRVCFAKTIQGCLIGVSEDKNISGEEFYVYKLKTDDYITPSKEQVNDVDITGEVWYTKEYDPDFAFKIKIGRAKSHEKHKLNGRTVKIPIWDYKVIERRESYFNY